MFIIEMSRQAGTIFPLYCSKSLLIRKEKSIRQKYLWQFP